MRARGGYTIVCSISSETMRDFLIRLRASVGLFEPGSVALAVMILTALAFFRVALLPEFGAELAMSTFQLGAVTTVFALGRLVADLPGGHLADRFPARAIMAVTASGLGVGSLLLGLAGAVLPVYAASFLLGMCSATTNATGMAYFSNATGAEFRGTSMAVFSAGLLGGQALGPAAAGVIASAAGWRTAMVTAAVVAGVLALFLLGGRGIGGPVGREPVTTGHDTAIAGRESGAMLILQAVSFVSFFMLGSIPQTLVPLIGADELGLGAAAIGFALGAGGLARFIGSLVGGRLADRLTRKSALVPSLLGQALGVGLLALPPTTGTWVAAILAMSLASYSVGTAATVLGDISDPSRIGARLGRFRFVGDLGLIVGPVTVTALYDGIGREIAVLLVSAFLAGVGLLCWRRLPETAPAHR